MRYVSCGDSQGMVPLMPPGRPPNPRHAGRGSLSPREANWRMSLSPNGMNQDPVISFDSLELTPTNFSPSHPEESDYSQVPEHTERIETKKTRGLVRKVFRRMTPKRTTTDKANTSSASKPEQATHISSRAPASAPTTSNISPGPNRSSNPQSTHNSRAKLPRSRSLPLPVKRDDGGRIKKSAGECNELILEMETVMEIEIDESELYRLACKATEEAKNLVAQAKKLNEAAERIAQVRDEMLARSRESMRQGKGGASPRRQLQSGAKITIQEPFNLSTPRRSGCDRSRCSSLDSESPPKPFKAKPFPNFMHGNGRKK